MIEFIICEDELYFLRKYKEIINKVMMKYDIEYKIKESINYNKIWYENTNSSNFKIYLLDIKTQDGSGLDAARYIREELDDWQSMITIISAYPEFKYEALEKRLMLVDFINKLDNLENRLTRAIQVSLKNYDNRPNSLKYTYKKVSYNIEYHKIKYIEKEQDNKRCIIKTKDKEYYIQGSLRQIESLLDKRFIKCNRSYIINLEQVRSYNTKANKIVFKDTSEIYDISRNKRKEIINYVRGIN
jgi:two-component system response regulator AgrA